MPVRNDRIDKGSGPGRGWGWLGLLGCMMIPLTVVAAGGDDYLEQIESEALKVEDDGAVAAPAAAAASETDIGDFEKELETHYRGSYLFYKKLSNRGQEEIFLEYQKGASIDAIRKKIMDRFLLSG